MIVYFVTLALIYNCISVSTAGGGNEGETAKDRQTDREIETDGLRQADRGRQTFKKETDRPAEIDI